MKNNPVTLWKNTDKKTPSLAKVKSEKPSKAINESADAALANAKDFGIASLPIITKLGIDLMCEPEGHGDYNFSFKPLGLPIAIGGIVLDTIKAPVCSVIATEEAVRAGITKVAALLFEKDPTEAEINRIFKSFLIRMRETVSLLVALGLAEKDILDNKLKSGDIEDLIGLTLLNTAYCSRNVSIGIFLASNKFLERRDCPAIGLPLFDKILELRDAIKDALNLRSGRRSESDETRNLEDSRRVCEWIAFIVKGVPISSQDKPEKSQTEITLINKVIALVNDLKKQGMSLMPVEPDKVAHQLPTMGRRR